MVYAVIWISIERQDFMLEILKSKWNEILDYMKYEFDIAEVAFKTFLVPLELHSVEDNTVYIIAEDDIGVSFINKRYGKYFTVTIAEFLGDPYEIVFVSRGEIERNKNIKKSGLAPSLNENPDLKSRIEEANLNPKYTFDTFVVGENNNFAQAYALKVAEAPGDICNPLFLYGGVGLGKTHLMHSIAHYILEHNMNAKVLYVTSETFTNELINCIRTTNNQDIINEFRNKYRNIDVFLIDDIQFIVGKDRCQEEFFHTFNDLYSNKKQIVISSDKPPKDMTDVEERLRARFAWGLSVDISSPDYETRMAILQKKAEQEGYDIDNDIFQYIANNITTNIRELEGALTKVIAYSKISPLKMDLELAKDVLKDSIFPNAQIEVNCKMIIQTVADHFNITTTDLSSKKKQKSIVLPRQIAMYLCKELTEDSYSAIGQLLGNRDHSTVMHGYDKIIKDLNQDEQLKNTIEVLKKKILPNS